MSKKLFRPKKGRVLFGVAQGLGEYFAIDPVIFRILFIVFTLSGGAGLILYIIGVFLMPDENKDSLKDEIEKIKNSKSTKEAKNKAKEHVKIVADEIRISKLHQHSSTIVFGTILIFIGIIFLFANFFPWFSWGKLWPAVLIFFGLLILVGN